MLLLNTMSVHTRIAELVTLAGALSGLQLPERTLVAGKAIEIVSPRRPAYRNSWPLLPF